MYPEFQQQFEAWIASHQPPPTSTTGAIEHVPDFLWHAPANEDDTLDSVVILGEN